MIRKAQTPRKRDPSIALINVVFLMLIFFLIAGTIAAPLESELRLVETEGLEGREPPDALVLRADGTLSYRGVPTNAARYMASRENGPVRVVPDRAANATVLVKLSSGLRELGATSVILVTERVLQ